MQGVPEISIVIPVINEAPLLPELFGNLTEQEGVRLEVIVSDGGSTDGTVETVHRLAERSSFPVAVISGPPGRGRQLNSGATRSCAPYLLFLHADSRFPDPRALKKGIKLLRAAGPGHAAGRFALTFVRRDPVPSFGYAFYEAKARLDRSGCIHGDQGMLVGRGLFEEAGRFSEALPFCEDTRLAEEIRRRGKWLLVPAEIRTSARRFETEGLKERQTLNAIIMNFIWLDDEPFLGRLPALYQSQDRNRRLQLPSLLGAIGRLIDELPSEKRHRLWYQTGRYVRDNAWQLAFALDAARAFRSGRPAAGCTTACLDFHDRYLDRLTDHPPGRFAAALFTRLWFSLTRLGLL